MSAGPSEPTTHPLDADRWADLERLFGSNGAYGGCWCMYFRLSGPEFSAGTGERNQAAFRDLVSSGRPTGVLAYRSGAPVGWVAIAPRADLARFRRSPLRVGAVDDPRVWSLNCLYVSREARGQGLGDVLVPAAVEHARREGAAVVEAIPLTERGDRDAAQLYVGTQALFERHGFRVAERPRAAPSRAVMRLNL